MSISGSILAPIGIKRVPAATVQRMLFWTFWHHLVEIWALLTSSDFEGGPEIEPFGDNSEVREGILKKYEFLIRKQWGNCDDPGGRNEAKLP